MSRRYYWRRGQRRIGQANNQSLLIHQEAVNPNVFSSAWSTRRTRLDSVPSARSKRSISCVQQTTASRELKEAFSIYTILCSISGTIGVYLESSFLVFSELRPKHMQPRLNLSTDPPMTVFIRIFCRSTGDSRPLTSSDQRQRQRGRYTRRVGPGYSPCIWQAKDLRTEGR